MLHQRRTLLHLRCPPPGLSSLSRIAPHALFTAPFWAHFAYQFASAGILSLILAMVISIGLVSTIDFLICRLLDHIFILTMISRVFHAAMSSCPSCPSCQRLSQYSSSAFAATAVLLKLFGPCPALPFCGAHPHLNHTVALIILITPLRSSS